MRKHKGLRLSVIGGVVALISMALLIVLPDLGPSIGMLVGGAMVWGGLLWTLIGYYMPPGESTPPG